MTYVFCGVLITPHVTPSPVGLSPILQDNGLELNGKFNYSNGKVLAEPIQNPDYESHETQTYSLGLCYSNLLCLNVFLYYHAYALQML